MLKTITNRVARLIGGAAFALATGASVPAMAQECFIGEVRMFAGNFAPRSWAFTDGQLLPIASNTALFSILGTTYGGDGRTTFGLPDLRGRTAIGPRTGPGLSPRTLGQKVGAETNTLNTNQLPSHSHSATTTSTLQATSTGGNSPDPTGRVLANDGTDRIYSDAAPNVSLNAAAIQSSTTVGNTGGNQSVNNMQPSLAINHIICLTGIFPSRS